MTLRTLDSLGSLEGKRVIVRCDLNVPLRDGIITDDGRVRASLPTLNALINAGARVVVCSHLGRPDGAPDPQYSLEPVAQRLSELLGSPVAFARDTVGESATDAVASLEDGGVVGPDRVVECVGVHVHLVAAQMEVAGQRLEAREQVIEQLLQEVVDRGVVQLHGA